MTTRSEISTVAAEVLSRLGSLNLYRFNKLLYLFEYLYIKNFGARFTKEKFVKLPHGPVVRDYKNRLGELAEQGIVNFDPDLLRKQRKLDDSGFEEVFVVPGRKIGEYRTLDPITAHFLNGIVERYGRMSCQELEEVVYRTAPVRTYLSKVGIFKKPTGGEVLGDCIRMRDHRTIATKGKRLFVEHLRKHPVPDPFQLERDADELQYFMGLKAEEQS